VNISPEETPRVHIEGPERLSRLDLWRQQRDYYHTRGVAAWASGEVPHSITNHPAHARALAQLVLGFLRDLRSELNPEHPVYIVELGAGAGRMAFLFLRELEELATVVPELKLRYVLTDGAPANLEFWRGHGQLDQLFRAGRLDRARLDLSASDWRLELEPSGEVLTAGAVVNPIIFLGNYVLDSLSQDVFHIKKPQVFESRISVFAPHPLDQGEFWPDLSVEYEDVAIEPASYYPQPAWSKLLASYAGFEDTYFSLPLGGLHCLDEMGKVSDGRFLFVSADKAWLEEGELAELEAPGLVVHGRCFSLTVNFHSMARYAEQAGGQAWLNSWRDSELHLGAWTSLGRSLPETALAFSDWVSRVGPNDIFHLRELVEEHVKSPNLRLCLELLRVSGWDPDLLYDQSQPMVIGLEQATPETIKELEEGLLHVWRRYYHIGESRDIPFEIARLFYQMDRFALARLFFDHSMKLFGPHPMTIYNLGLCFHYEGDKPKALSHFKEAVRLGYAPARDWVKKLRGR